VWVWPGLAWSSALAAAGLACLPAWLGGRKKESGFVKQSINKKDKAAAEAVESEESFLLKDLNVILFFTRVTKCTQLAEMKCFEVNISRACVLYTGVGRRCIRNLMGYLVVWKPWCL
jgi:hypothetical protein